MRIKALFLRSAAAGVIAVTALLAASIPLAAPAEAAGNINVSIDIGTFYDRLSPYGDWVSLQGRTVWVPARRPLQWQPYRLGHWAYTNRYGWIWVSDEPFGWATYHYGRWGYGDDIGWYWVPGYRWAPAWVSWRRSDEYVAWSPLPVNYPDEFGVNITIGAVPNFYWQVVPSRSFLSPNLTEVIIHDRNRADIIIRNTRHEGGVRIVNKVIVNNVIDSKFIEKKSQKKVQVYQVEATDRPDKSGKLRGDSIDVFAPQVKKGGEQKPKQIQSLNEVKARHKKDLGTSQGQTSKQQTQTQKPQEQQQTGEQSGNKKKLQGQTSKQQTQTQKPQDQQQTGQSGNKKKLQGQTGQQQIQKPQDQQQTGQSGNKKKLQGQTGQQQIQKPQDQQQKQTGQSANKKKLQGQISQQQTGDQTKKKKN